MARWEPNARGRLVRAALELCTTHGYDATTVAQIADRAGLTKTTFFRHFPDKREVLFAGQDEHSRILAEAIAAAPAEATPLATVAAAAAALAATFTDEQREFGQMLMPLIAAHDDLKERAAYKHARLAQATSTALQAREVPPATADLAAELALRAFHDAFATWIETDAKASLATLTMARLKRLRAAAALLDASRASRPTSPHSRHHGVKPTPS